MRGRARKTPGPKESVFRPRPRARNGSLQFLNALQQLEHPALFADDSSIHSHGSLQFFLALQQLEHPALFADHPSIHSHGSLELFVEDKLGAPARRDHFAQFRDALRVISDPELHGRPQCLVAAVDEPADPFGGVAGAALRPPGVALEPDA